MNKVLLLTRPNFDPGTNYLFYWSQQVISEAKRRQFKVLDLKAKKAKREVLKSYISRQNPSLVFFNGHGSKDSITGQNNEVLIKIDDKENILSKRIIYARCCNAASSLGKECVKRGTIAFIGYKKKFFLAYSIEKISRPLEDNVARLFLEPSNLIPTSLVRGNSVSDAYKKSQKKMYRNLRFMLSSEATPKQKGAASLLWRNIKNQKVIGDYKAKIFSPSQA